MQNNEINSTRQWCGDSIQSVHRSHSNCDCLPQQPQYQYWGTSGPGNGCNRGRTVKCSV